MSRKVGDRVGAICSANATEVRFFGYGVYEGDLEPPFGPLGFTKEEFEQSCREVAEEGGATNYIHKPYTNPCIKLDNGGTVWGCQCWWGPEEQIKTKIGDRKVIMVRLNDQGESEVIPTETTES